MVSASVPPSSRATLSRRASPPDWRTVGGEPPCSHLPNMALHIARARRLARLLSVSVSYRGAPAPLLPRPIYFPLKAEPLRMQAGLARFGTDFGNGQADQLLFPLDVSAVRLVEEKA